MAPICSTCFGCADKACRFFLQSHHALSSCSWTCRLQPVTVNERVTINALHQFQVLHQFQDSHFYTHIASDERAQLHQTSGWPHHSLLVIQLVENYRRNFGEANETGKEEDEHSIFVTGIRREGAPLSIPVSEGLLGV